MWICQMLQLSKLPLVASQWKCEFTSTINVEIEELQMQASASVARVCGAWEVTAWRSGAKFNVYLIMIVLSSDVVPVQHGATCPHPPSTMRCQTIVFCQFPPNPDTEYVNIQIISRARSNTAHKAPGLTINFQIQLLRPFDDVLLEISIAFRNFCCPRPTVNWFIQKAPMTKNSNCPISIFP